jgi:hypothetical protein
VFFAGMSVHPEMMLDMMMMVTKFAAVLILVLIIGVGQSRLIMLYSIFSVHPEIS